MFKSGIVVHSFFLRKHGLMKIQAPNKHFNFAQSVIKINTSRAGKVAFIDDYRQVTYAELATSIRQFATALTSLNIQQEQRVLLVMLDTIDLPVAFLGCLYAGVIPVIVNTLLQSSDYAYMLEHSHARAVFVSDVLYPNIESALQTNFEKTNHDIAVIISGEVMDAAPNATSFSSLLEKHAEQNEAARVHRDDIAFWLYSSGSTGRPKGTVHTHANLYWTAELYGKQTLQIRETDITFSAAKLFFAYGLGNGLTFPLSVGATVILMSERPTAEAIFKRLTVHQPTLFFGAPTLFASMFASPQLPARSEVNLRACVSAGESLPEVLGTRFTDHFKCFILDGIGSTEMLHIYISNKHGDVHYGTTGKPVTGYDIELRDAQGQPVPAGTIGDLYVRGPSAALMYWTNRDKSISTFLGEWTKTGDKFICNEQGYYIYVGRSDDMMKVSGQYVSPIEVESTLMSHAAVLECAVVGKPDDEGLLKAHAYIILNEEHMPSDALAKELQQFVKARLTPHKYPRYVHFVKDLPKTATGKIQRFRLRTEIDGGVA